MKIGTYNIRVLTGKESRFPWQNRFWLKRMKLIAENILSADLDVVCVQEAYTCLQLYGLQLYLKDYDFISVAQSTLHPQRNAIFYKKTVGMYNRKNIFISSKIAGVDHQRTTVTAQFQCPGVDTPVISVMCIHLSPYSEELCIQGYENIHDEVFGKDNYVIAGDFNMLSDAPIHQLLATKTEMVQCLFYDPQDYTYTGFNGWFKNKIDYIYVSPNLVYTPILTMGTDMASDHKLCYTEIIKKL